MGWKVVSARMKCETTARRWTSAVFGPEPWNVRWWWNAAPPAFTSTGTSRSSSPSGTARRTGASQSAGAWNSPRFSGEREEDLNAIAAPVFDADGDLAGIVGLQGPASRFGRNAMRTAVDPLLSAVREISLGLGWE